MEGVKLKPIVCEICNKGFKIKDFLYSHTMSLHGQVRKFCGLCKVFFETEPDLRIHNLVSHDTSFLICGQRHCDILKCKLQFKSEDELHTHLEEKKEERKPCEICAEKFNGGKRYKCKWKHMVFVHGVGKLFICGKCDAWYAKSVDSLIEHEKSRGHFQLTDPSTKAHISLDGNFISCKVCGRKFEFVKTLIQHIKDKHREILRNTDRPKPFKCCFCKKKFEKEGDSKLHISAMHSQLLDLDDDMGEFDSKIDVKIEVKLEPVVKQEYYEEIIDIKPEGDFVEDFVKKEDDLVYGQVDIKIEEDFKTFTKENRIDDENPLIKKKVPNSAINTLSIKDLIQGKQTQNLIASPCLSLAPANYHYMPPSMYPIIPPTQYPSFTQPPLPPAQYEYGYQQLSRGSNCLNQPASLSWYFDDAGNLVQRRAGGGS